MRGGAFFIRPSYSILNRPNVLYTYDQGSLLKRNCSDKSDQIFEFKECKDFSDYLEEYKSFFCNEENQKFYDEDKDFWDYFEEYKSLHSNEEYEEYMNETIHINVDMEYQTFQLKKKIWEKNCAEEIISKLYEKHRNDDPHHCQDSCSHPGPKCQACTNPKYFNCTRYNTSVCLNPELRCDGHPQCDGGEDEALENCYETYLEEGLVDEYATVICTSPMYGNMKIVLPLGEDSPKR